VGGVAAFAAPEHFLPVEGRGDMKPYYDHAGIVIYHGDCLEEMRNIPDGCIDLILTDPPYGTTACQWDSVIPFDSMWVQLKRVIKSNGAIVLFGSEPFSSALRMSNIKEYKYDWIWEKSIASNFVLSKKQPQKKHENISVFYSSQPFYCPQMMEGEPYIDKRTVERPVSVGGGKGLKKKALDNKGFRYPKSIQFFSNPNHENVHPTQKPLALMEYLIRTYTKKTERVLDFTMGSGTTGVACKNMNRKFIGIEQNIKYCEIAAKRLSQEVLPL
jgi:DNA modification methylase